MAIKNIIAKGIGFSPATSKWIVTHGFTSSTAVADLPLYIKASIIFNSATPTIAMNTATATITFKTATPTITVNNEC